nr:hypothetical protein [Pandoravirus belohorizontensis]
MQALDRDRFYDKFPSKGERKHDFGRAATEEVKYGGTSRSGVLAVDVGDCVALFAFQANDERAWGAVFHGRLGQEHDAATIQANETFDKTITLRKFIKEVRTINAFQMRIALRQSNSLFIVCL